MPFSLYLSFDFSTLVSIPTSSELGMVESESEAVDIQAILEVELEKIEEANTEESVVAAAAINLVILPSNPKKEETAEEDKEEEGPAETHHSPPPTNTSPPPSLP